MKPFKLERYFAKYEFSAPYLLSCSDCEALSLEELLAMADENALQMWHALKLGYTESCGHPALREEITGLYRTIQPDDVLTIIPEEGIFIAMNNILEQGDHVVTTFPGYQSLYEIARSLGCEVSRWTPRDQNGWTFDIRDFNALVKKNTKLIVINFPHNPTGAVLPEAAFNAVMNVARQQNMVIFSDEMYRLLEYDPGIRLTPACDLYENAVSLSGLSKSFALAGLRTGWLATKNTDLLRKCMFYKDYTTICSSAPSEILAIMALRAKEEILTRNLDLINRNLKILDTFFARHEDLFRWPKPEAGPIGFPELTTGMDATAFCQDLADKKGVMLLPSDVYEYGNRHFRIGFARRNMPEALSKLEEYLKESHFQ